MITFGNFRLLDKVLSHQPGKRLVTECLWSSRRILVNTMGEAAFLMELAAQTGALMNRLEGVSLQDHFLGKIKSMEFFPWNRLSSHIITWVMRLGGNGRLTHYQGQSMSPSGTVFSSFDLLICTTHDLGGNGEKRSLYWRDHLANLPKGDQDA